MKKKFIGVIGIVIAVIVGGIYYLTREEKIELSLKNKKEILVEYGNTVQYSFDDLIQTKDIDKDKLKEIKKETKITDNLKNEDQKDYPAIGNYTINIKYQDQKLKKKVIVKDTTAPVFNEINEVSFEEGTENYDFNQEIKATDLSNIDLQYDLSSLDINKAGDYQIKVFAKDSSGNQAEKEITVHVKEVRKCKKERLFYTLQYSKKNHFSNAVSGWFARYLKSLHIEGRNKVFHSFRHLVKPMLRDAGIAQEYQNAICGWSSNDIGERVYGDKVPIKKLYEEICKLQYPFLEKNLQEIKKLNEK